MPDRVVRGFVAAISVAWLLCGRACAHDIGRISIGVGSYYANFGGLTYPVLETNTPWFKQTTYVDAVQLVFAGVRWPDTLACSPSAGGAFMCGSQPKSYSNDSRSPDYDPSATQEQMIYCVWTDTCALSGYYDESGRRLDPLGIQVHQKSYAFSDSFASRFIIIDNWIVNASDWPIEHSCLGIDVQPRTYNPYISKLTSRLIYYPGPHDRTQCGFLKTAPGIVEGIDDTLNLAWAADMTGDPIGGMFTELSTTAVAGVRVLRTPGNADVYFNWFQYWYLGGWGPRRIESFDYPARGYSSIYQSLSNGETDYDQVYSAIDFSAEGWSAPSDTGAFTVAGGGAPSFVLSCGPISAILPGDSVQFVYAIVMGDDFHTDPNHFANTFDYNNPAPYLNGLNFTNLITGAQWAGWFFDNPGVDTDGDGYAGEFYLIDCDGYDCDSVYYSGDGVPDFKGPQPPPPPLIEYETFPQKIIVRWTGALSEFARDRYSRRPDWEGYRVYIAEDDTSKGFSALASWDREDYIRFSYRPISGDWKQNSGPLTIEEWRQALSDLDFDPNRYKMPSLVIAYVDTAVDTVRTASGTIIDIIRHERRSYFAPGDANSGNTYASGGRTFANKIQQVGVVDTVIDGQARQYGVYEFELDWLSESKSYYIAVTAFDFGDYRTFVESEESRPGDNFKYFRALYSADVVVDSGLKVNVHPNPYKIRFTGPDGEKTSYFRQGYELISRFGKFNERDRRIWFTNLPDTATIEIYSLDGDLIRRINHPNTYLTHYSSAVGWDLISRNQQAVTSGIYIWRVTSRLGEQAGKLVIIK